MYVPRLRMAMRIGGEYGVEAANGRHWRRFAQANFLDPDETIERIDGLASRTPDASATAAANKPSRPCRAGCRPASPTEITTRAAQCRKQLKQ